MSIPRVLLAPTHRSSIANAVAAGVAELLAARGERVRYHHLGPLAPGSVWDRWAGAVFLDPGLYDETTLLSLYEIATRNATFSLLSCSRGLLDTQEGVFWTPLEVAKTLDCPVIVLVDCRDWAEGIRIIGSGLRACTASVDLAGVVLTGVAESEHFRVLKEHLAKEGLKVVGCLFAGDGPGWGDSPPGAWGVPLDKELLSSLARQVDLQGLVALGGRRGFLPSRGWPEKHEDQKPLVAVAGGNGFTLWSRDSVEVLRAAGAEVCRLDLLGDSKLPEGVSGLVLAGTLWPSSFPDVSLNVVLLGAIREAVERGMPTVALGGGLLLLLRRVQDTIGRSCDMAGVIEAEAEVVWDLEEPVYVELAAASDGLLLAENDRVLGWTFAEVEISSPGDSASPRDSWAPAFWAKEPGHIGGLSASGGSRRQPGGIYPGRTDVPEGFSSASLLGSRFFVHLASVPGMAARFVERCKAFALTGEAGPFV